MGAAEPFETQRPTDPAFHSIPISRWLAIAQVVMVSGIPTQLILAVILILGVGIPLSTDGGFTGLSLEFLSTLMLLDTALTAVLIRVFLEMSGETSRAVFLGRKRIGREALVGLLLVPLTFAGVTGVVLLLRTIAPGLNTVETSPMLQFMSTPFDAAVFLVVVVLGGGVKEELQRAFILHRFKYYLGGIRVGLAAFSIWFGVLHFDQGLDVALAIGLLGLFWGILYIKRRSAVMGIVNHAGFNAGQVIQVMIARLLGY